MKICLPCGHHCYVLYILYLYKKLSLLMCAARTVPTIICNKTIKLKSGKNTVLTKIFKWHQKVYT